MEKETLYRELEEKGLSVYSYLKPSYKTRKEIVRLWGEEIEDVHFRRYLALKGQEICPKCGGFGGYEGWPGFTCFKCDGKGII